MDDDGIKVNRNSTPAEGKFEHFCIVELMGHQRIAGKVTEQNLFGGALMRVDVPGVDDRAGFTKFFGASAIYAITPVEEQIARAMAKAIDTRPVEEWQLKRLLAAPDDEDTIREMEASDDHFYDDDDDDDFGEADFAEEEEMDAADALAAEHELENEDEDED